MYWLVSPDATLSIEHTNLAFPQLRARWLALRVSVESHDDMTSSLFLHLLTKATNVVSCKSMVSSETLSRPLGGSTIKKALLANPRLETLHLTCDEMIIINVS